MNYKKNPSGLREAIGLSMAGYPVFIIIFYVIIAKLTMNNDLVNEMECKYRELVGSFVDLKADQARMREISLQKRRHMKKLNKECRKVKRIVKQTMPREKWPEFGIDINE